MRVVTEGLSDGDVVIVNGLQRVRPGTPVNATKVAMDEPALTRLAAAEHDVEVATYGDSGAYRIE